MEVEERKTKETRLDTIKQINKTTNELNKQLKEILIFLISEIENEVNEINRRSTGISLLELKNDLLMSYLHNLTNLLIIRISQTNRIQPSSLKNEQEEGEEEEEEFSNKIVEQLVWLRLVFEKLRPIESRLKYQIEKLIKTVLELDHLSFDNNTAEIDHVMNDPLSFKPNPFALEAPNQVEEDRDVSDANNKGREKEVEGRSKEIYRPPRVAPVVYPEANGKTKRIGPAPVALREHVSLSTNAPLPESTTGLSNTAVKCSNRAKALARMKEYEEANMTRLFTTKKDARRRRDDEAAIALGIQTSATSKNQKRKLGALEGEFDGVLNEISRKNDRYSHHLGSSSKPNHQKLSNLSGSTIQTNSSTPANRQKFNKKKGGFDKALKKISK